jgi:hypothetical protein
LTAYLEESIALVEICEKQDLVGSAGSQTAAARREWDRMTVTVGPAERAMLAKMVKP